MVITAITVPASVSAFELPAQMTPKVIFADETTTSYTYLSGTVVANASPITTITAEPKVSPYRRVTTPRTYEGSSVVMEGIASYYSKAGCLGCNPLFVMANGEQLDDNALTMAIGADKKHLVGYKARVTNLVNGQSVVVRITDTGGFYKDKYGNRVADLTIGTKQAIGMKGGLGRVRVEVL
jgi:rare lipoprotein A (peptidoglycan hydrolase)